MYSPSDAPDPLQSMAQTLRPRPQQRLSVVQASTRQDALPWR
jgi:hypothetical protein